MLLAHDLIMNNLTCDPKWQFECQNRSSEFWWNKPCVPRSSVCNFVKDCSDGSDEKLDLCSNRTCRNSTEFRCKSGQCISSTLRCNKQFECTDKSDEDHCDHGRLHICL